MPETRYIIEYENGVEVKRIPYVVSDDELDIEAVEKETHEANDQALVAYKSWANLSANQKDRVLKGLLGDFVSRNKIKYI